MKTKNKNEQLKRLISEDYRCTCNTYKAGFTDKLLFDDLFSVISNHGLNPTIKAETLKLLLGTVLEIKYKPLETIKTK